MSNLYYSLTFVNCLSFPFLCIMVTKFYFHSDFFRLENLKFVRIRKNKNEKHFDWNKRILSRHYGCISVTASQLRYNWNNRITSMSTKLSRRENQMFSSLIIFRKMIYVVSRKMIGWISEINNSISRSTCSILSYT